MVKRVIALVALLLVVVPGLGIAQAASAPARTAGPIGGTLASESTTSGVTTLVVNTVHRGQVTVNVSFSTIYVRRYNGASALDEISLGDSLKVDGSFATGSTTIFNAARVRDFSIQEAATRAVLQVKTINAATNSFTGLVLHDSVRRVHPFDEGATVTVTVSTSGTPSTHIMMLSNGKLVAASFGNITTSQQVTVLGVYNRKLHSYTKTLLVRIHG